MNWHASSVVFSIKVLQCWLIHSFENNLHTRWSGKWNVTLGELERRVRDQSLKVNWHIWGVFNSMRAVVEDHSSQMNVSCLEGDYWRRFKPSDSSQTHSLVIQTIRKMPAISLGKSLNTEMEISLKICI